MKKYLLGMIAIVIALGLSSFSIKPQRTTGEKVWFLYNGGGENIPANYSYLSGQMPQCADEVSLCEIYAEPVDPGDPENSVPDLTTVEFRTYHPF
jgi:hypothetical protein